MARIRRSAQVLLLFCVACALSGIISVAAKASFRSINAVKAENLIELIDQGDLIQTATDIAVVRVPNTSEHDAVQTYIISKLLGTKWELSKDSFTDDTPLGKKKFTNLIATWNPSAPKFIVFAAHYDSKLFTNFQFTAATDSAVPCAILIHVAKALTSKLPDQSQIGAKIVFFDGEEAFEEWTGTDHTYGSRHLAEEWEAEGFLPQIELFVLLDLLGDASLKLYSTNADTDYAFQQLQNIEDRLIKSNIIRSNTRLFDAKRLRYFIEDDHVPFLRKGVPTLHLISAPFPPQWHTARDTMANINSNITFQFTQVFAVFAAEILQISI